MANPNFNQVIAKPAVKALLKVLLLFLLMAPYFLSLEALRPENVESLEDLTQGVHLLARSITLTVLLAGLTWIFTAPDFLRDVALFNEGYALAAAKRRERQANASSDCEPEADCSKAS